VRTPTSRLQRRCWVARACCIGVYWLQARISSLIKALTRSPTPSIILASDCVENVCVGSSQHPIPRSLRLRSLTSCLWSRNAPAICPSSAPLDLLDVGPRQSRVHLSRLRRPASDFHVGGLCGRGARAVRVVYALARRVAHEARRLYGGNLAARRELGVHDAQGYAEKVPLLERERPELEGLRGPAAGRLRLSAA
jgi:hypothetical protein